jgi:hypothetical protein
MDTMFRLAWAFCVAALLLADASRSARAQGPAEGERTADATAAPAAGLSDAVRAAADGAAGLHLVVSLEERRLWLRDGGIVLHAAPVAVGKTTELEFGERRWSFETPTGRRRVIGKQENPIWIPPDWHYAERAAEHGYRLAAITRDSATALADGSRLVVRGDRIERVFPDGAVERMPVGEEIIFGRTLYVPPFGTANRRIAGELGRYKLDLGDGYLLHGTPRESSIGKAVTHGCIRLLDADLELLYRSVPVGTAVYIY